MFNCTNSTSGTQPTRPTQLATGKFFKGAGREGGARNADKTRQGKTRPSTPMCAKFALARWSAGVVPRTKLRHASVVSVTQFNT
jgi:hypothetical protein